MIPLASCAPITGNYWYPVQSDHIQNMPWGQPIGAQDTNQFSENWRSVYQDSGNKLSIYIALMAHFNENQFY
jgi:hypothetical protein